MAVGDTPGWFGRIVAGLIGGLAAGGVFGTLMQMTGTIPMVAQLVERESYLAGWAVHMSIAAFVGVTYALLFGLFAVSVSVSTLLGIFYGLIWWVLGGLTLMPLRLGAGLFVLETGAWQSLAGHVAYGLTLGLLFVPTAYLFARGTGRHRPAAADEWSTARQPEPVPGPPPAPDQRPGAPHPHVPPHPQVPAQPRTPVTPLSPQARQLRQQRHLR